MSITGTCVGGGPAIEAERQHASDQARRIRPGAARRLEPRRLDRAHAVEVRGSSDGWSAPGRGQKLDARIRQRTAERSDRRRRKEKVANVVGTDQEDAARRARPETALV